MFKFGLSVGVFFTLIKIQFASGDLSIDQKIRLGNRKRGFTELDVRLVDGISMLEGRVEIRYKGTWGTICGDEFTSKAAEVVCHMLGYQRLGATPYRQAAYGKGKGPIWLAKVKCHGNETSLGDCQHLPWGSNDCRHRDDAGVKCQGNDKAKLLIRDALDEWEAFSCLDFSKDVFYNDDYNKIVFTSNRGGKGCASTYIGMKQGPQEIHLGKECLYRDIILHEIGHALGFYHEHNRADRDRYIKVHRKNIAKGYKHQFKKMKKGFYEDFGKPYDYKSIMHYGRLFFSRDESQNLTTMETLDPEFQDVIGKAKHPSFFDYKILNDMYECSAGCGDVQCPKRGFLGKYCRCFCEGNQDNQPITLCFKENNCPNPSINLFLFDVLDTLNETAIDMTRDSYPDNIKFNVFSTNLNCSVGSELLCENGKWKGQMPDCPVELGIELTEGSDNDGIIEVSLNEQRGLICDDNWDDNDATVACRMMGFEFGKARVVNSSKVNESLPILLDELKCSGNESTLSECNHNGWGKHDCEHSEVAAIKCLPYIDTKQVDVLSNYDCGKIPLKGSKRKKREVRIVGGAEAVKGMYPWQVRIQRMRGRWIHWCGGTIISSHWILSAAHCFDDLKSKYDDRDLKMNYEDFRVSVGDHDVRQDDEHEQTFHIEYLVKHWQYREADRINPENDIALLKIDSDSGADFNDYVQPACLPGENISIDSGMKCEVSGWGKRTESGSTSNILRSVEVSIVEDMECNNLYKKYSIDTRRVFCAGNVKGGTDTCKGDSGGPLVCDIKDRNTVIGITSWGEGCGRPDAPGVYTNVSSFVSWIKQQISLHDFVAFPVLDVCSLPLQTPCPRRESGPFWYYEKLSGHCKKVPNGDCNDNQNNFRSQAECEAYCSKQRVCRPLTYESDIRCLAYFDHWTYNVDSGVCEMFVYGGCGGSANNFDSQNACNRKCIGRFVEPVVTRAPEPASAEEICAMVEDSGNCLAYFRNWRYDSLIGKCIQFTYGGCGGNANNFQSQEECEAFCTRNVVCQKHEDPENGCLAYMRRRWRYEPSTGACQNFIYVGCGGNANNFETSEACEGKCVAREPEREDNRGNSNRVSSWREICNLPADVGPCKQYKKRWHYNSVSQGCDEFIYGDCLGNHNNFESQEQCRTYCDSSRWYLPERVATTAEPDITIDESSGEIPAAQPATGVGCGGNANNFETSEACEGKCVAREPEREDNRGNSNRVSSWREICNLPADVGPCKQYKKRWHYNSVSQGCDEFIYGDCLGNHNNFESQEQCRTYCDSSRWYLPERVATTAEPDITIDESSGEIPAAQPATGVDVCHLESYSGRCRAYIRSWYYDHLNGECKQFVYGGCDTNGNRFDTRGACEAQCSPRDVCLQPQRTGNCMAYILRFYFDYRAQECKEFVYGGCDGNANSFETKDACERRCEPLMRDRGALSNWENL